MGHARDSRYAARAQHDLLALLRAQPMMAWLVSAGGEDAAFTPLPRRAECTAAGRLVALRGHLARRNPHVARLNRAPQAQALVLGPHADVSPSWPGTTGAAAISRTCSTASTGSRPRV